MGSLLMVALMAAVSAPESPVADAAQRGDFAAVQELVARGADVNAPQGDGMTALHWAAELGNAEMASALVRAGAKVDATTRVGAFTPLHIASELGHAQVVGTLLRAGADHEALTSTGGEAALHLAAKSGDLVTMAALLDNGADVDVRQALWGQTPLMFAASWNQPEAVKALLARGADPAITSKVLDLAREEARDRRSAVLRDSALAAMRAASPDPVSWVPTPAEVQAAVEIVRLYEAGSPVLPVEREDIERVDWDEIQMTRTRPLTTAQVEGYKGGLTALLHAAREGHREVALALLEGGADVNQVSAGDLTSPLLMAMIQGWFDLGLVFLERGADPNIASDAGATPLYAVVEKQWGARPRTPQRMYHLVQKSEYLGVMQALLDAGADPNLRLKKHLWYMAYTGSGGGYLGIDVWGATPFWRAAYALDIPAMELLVAYGADPHIPTKAPPGRVEFEDDDGPEGVALEPGSPGVYPIHAASGFGNYTASNYQRWVEDGWIPAVDYLVKELGADPTVLDYKGFGTAHYAAMRGNNELLLHLVALGADPTVVGHSGQTASDLANGPGQGGVRFDDTLALLWNNWGVAPTRPCLSCAELNIRIPGITP